MSCTETTKSIEKLLSHAVTSSWLHGKIQGLVLDRSEKEKLLADCFNEDLVISSLSRFICKLCEHRMIGVQDPWEAGSIIKVPRAHHRAGYEISCSNVQTIPIGLDMIGQCS